MSRGQGQRRSDRRWRVLVLPILSAILFEMSSDADWPWLAPDFFMFSS